jgi:hypothetical protein
VVSCRRKYKIGTVGWPSRYLLHRIASSVISPNKKKEFSATLGATEVVIPYSQDLPLLQKMVYVFFLESRTFLINPSGSLLMVMGACNCAAKLGLSSIIPNTHRLLAESESYVDVGRSNLGENQAGTSRALFIDFSVVLRLYYLGLTNCYLNLQPVGRDLRIT